MSVLPTADMPLVAGARAGVVAALQQALQERGYYAFSPDGVVGPDTIEGVRQAIADLTRSPSQDARRAVRLATMNASTGQILAVLTEAWRQADAFKVLTGGTVGAALDGTPTLPDAEIEFTPAQLARTIQKSTAAKVGISLAWWQWGLVAAGVGAAGYGLYRAAK
jgi:peptidoglycan hydrolase-like protein with peptidoglycan-binding domain